MYELLSQRIRNKDGELEVYEYDFFNDIFRNQCFYIIQDVLDKYDSLEGIWKIIHDCFAREKGVKTLYSSSWLEKSNCEMYISKSINEDFLDFLDFIFNRFDIACRNNPPRNNNLYFNELIDMSIKELNIRFKQHNLGYEFVNSQIIRIDNKVLHETVIKPALKLLYTEGFEGAEEEFRKAFDYRKKGDNKNVILEALKSFESTMKTICDKKQYTYDKQKDTAKDLILILQNNQFYPSYMNNHLTNVRTTLESGLPVLRNKKAGHGQGATVVNVSDEFTEYALNLAATNIVLLTKIYQANK
ncbi:hypothetical protein CLPUN_46980 [Clostridium puniceum]|uniref:Abortive infection protein-like C-terminal domain-containing protein n=1 Tax=Clostridium puniceum TaxID=29367 RepID=A0A1S8T4U7_9CLOT|nr:hypothetical protein [Clostridium puniceum]OOM72505.1 hypothetical protein CLPUN_46980 [Clostridium puniceum]